MSHQCAIRMHHSVHAHFRRAMDVDEGTFATPPVLDFNCVAMQKLHNFELLSEKLSAGRDTVIARIPSSSEHQVECMNSLGSQQSKCISC